MSGCKAQKAPVIPMTPKSDYSGKVVVDPVTRIEGHLRIMVEVENGKIKNAWSSSQLFRGLEIILKGRDPRDAQHFTQRSCGVCTNVHALASVRCVDNAAKVVIPKNATLIRNLVLAAQFLHDHVVHFYHLHALDWVDVTSALAADPKKAAKIADSHYPKPDKADALAAVQAKLKSFVEAGQLGPFTNAYFLGGHKAYYLPPEVNLLATAHYLSALRLQVKAARAMAVFGGKNPHPQFTIPGGVTCYDALKPERIAEFQALFNETMQFVTDFYLPDVLAVAPFYLDWGGIGGTTNFLTCGEFPEDEYNLDSRYLPPGVIMNRDIAGVKPFNPDNIAEAVKYSWYEAGSPKHPYDGVTKPKYTYLDDPEHYSWMKAPRYKGAACEVGPLAQCLVAYAKGHKPTVDAVNMVLGKLGVGPEALFSTLGRTAARCIETVVTMGKMQDWINELAENAKKGNTKIYQEYEMPKSAHGVGFVNAPRGALSHWINIEDGKIANYQLVVPSTWNLGPRCDKGTLGPVEEALIGTPIADPKRPVEILRTVHSYDPCIACGVHVIDPDSNEVHVFQA
jgi:[NiFe] hydrogenase large subunit